MFKISPILNRLTIMNRSRSSTPVKTSKKEPKPCQDVEEEFAKRALQLMTSFYEPIPVADILNFPPVEPTAAPVEEKKIIFNSSLADLRVKKAQENQVQAIREFNNTFSQKVDSLAETCRNSNVNLENVFGAEQAERPMVPLYIVNEKKDQEEADKRKRTQVKALNMTKVETEMKQRLVDSEKLGKSKAEQRVKRLSSITEESKKIDRSKNTSPWRGRLTQFGKLTKYEPEGGYPVKQRKSSPANGSTYYKQD